MLRILGSAKQACDGLTRRDLLHAGSLSMLGLTLETLLARSSAQAAPAAGSASFGKAKSCILLYLYGAPSQLETFDPKPQAPVEIQGEMKATATSLPGVPICEELPHTARVVDRCTIVRSMTHPYPVHGAAYALTSSPTTTVPMELNPHHAGHWPFIGSVVDYVDDKRAGGAARAFRAIWLCPGRSARGAPAKSTAPDPIRRSWAAPISQPGRSSRAADTRAVTKTQAERTEEFYDPYLGIDPNCEFHVGGGQSDITVDRLNRRRSLLEQFDRKRAALLSGAATASYDRFQQQGFSLISSGALRDALDIRREEPAVRESYGMTLFGQASLAARRLVEAGSRLVTVVWDEYGLAGSAWDTHWNHYPRMREQLLPGFDRAFAGLILDLERRGLLDETVVCCLSEHGRTPKLSTARGGGRGHWSRAYSAIFAGGGIAAGNVVGKTDKTAADVTATPMSPKDVLATLYHLLGIDPHGLMYDKLGRAHAIAGAGRVRNEMLA